MRSLYSFGGSTTLSSGDLLLTLIAWCSAQHSADLAQAGRRQSLADQQHRLF